MEQQKKDPHRYDDIIHLPHPVSKNHPPMDAESRAAQFAPFAALGPIQSEESPPFDKSWNME